MPKYSAEKYSFRFLNAGYKPDFATHSWANFMRAGLLFILMRFGENSRNKKLCAGIGMDFCLNETKSGKF
jgi:hypothetical protein